MQLEASNAAAELRCDVGGGQRPMIIEPAPSDEATENYFPFVCPIFQEPGAVCHHHVTSEAHYRVRSGDQGSQGASGNCDQSK